MDASSTPKIVKVDRRKIMTEERRERIAKMRLLGLEVRRVAAAKRKEEQRRMKVMWKNIKTQWRLTQQIEALTKTLEEVKRQSASNDTPAAPQ